jgi:hypothetical protein
MMYYNLVRIHKTLCVTPAMAAGVTGKLMDMRDLVRIIDEREEKIRGDKIFARYQAQEAARRKLTAIN